MPFLGQAVPLSFQLLDGDDTKFCRAIVKDPDGVSISESPVSLFARGNGSYSSNSLAMPNLSFLDVTYQSFNDSAFSVVDTDHLLGGDTFALEIPDTVILNKLTAIENKLNGLSLGGGGVTAKVRQEMICEIIDDTRDLKAIVEGDITRASIQDTTSTSVDVVDSRVDVTVDPLDTGVKT